MTLAKKQEKILFTYKESSLCGKNARIYNTIQAQWSLSRMLECVLNVKTVRIYPHFIRIENRRDYPNCRVRISNVFAACPARLSKCYGQTVLQAENFSLRTHIRRESYSDFRWRNYSFYFEGWDCTYLEIMRVFNLFKYFTTPDFFMTPNKIFYVNK